MGKTASGQVGPKNEKNRPPGKRVKRGRLHFAEEEVTRQAGEPTSGQVGPKPAGGGKFRQDEEREKLSSRLRQDDEARRDTAHEEQDAQKARKDKQEKKKERAEAKAEHSAVKLEAAKEKLAQQKPQKPPGLPQRAATAAGAGVWAYTHRKIHEVEHENVGVESAHKAELLAEAGVHKATRYTKRRIREHPARQVEKWEHKTMKANANLHYQQMAQEHPELQSSFLSRMAQKWKIKREYAKAARKGGAATAKKAAESTRKAAKKTAEETRKAALFVARHPVGVLIAIAALLLFIIIFAGLSSCSSMFSGAVNGVVGTSYTSEDSDLVAVENNYAAMENELQAEIDNIENTHPGYDEYRYDLDAIGHNPHELASYLTALLQSYTPQSAQAEIERIFDMQYTLTLTEEVEVRYRTETRTDSEGNSYTVEVPYNYYILNVKLETRPITSLAPELLNDEQLEMFRVYMEMSGNKPLIFGGGSPDGSPSEDISGVQFVNGTRPGNTVLVDLAKQQVGNVGGYPYWSWYGFNSRVEWCACFVSWCYNQAGASEPRFSGCQSQGVPWFQSRGQWGARDYENIAPGDAIFFDWDLDGSADHVGIVIGTDGSRVYTVEGNSGDACKIKSYALTYECIKGYGLMNWD